MNVEDTPDQDGDESLDLPAFFGGDDGDADELDPFEPDADDGDEEDPADDDGDEDAEEDDAPRAAPPKTVPYKRLQQVVAERNELREHVGELKAVQTQHKEFLAGISARYGKYANPINVLGSDADFMDAMETLARTDPSIKDLYKKVTTSMANPGAAAAAPAKDARLDRIMEREARRTAEDTLAPLKLAPKYQKLIVDHVITNGGEPADVTPEVVKKLTKAFLKDRGFTIDEMRAPAVPAAKPKPNTGRQGAPSAATPRRAKPAAEAPKFKNREELLTHRQRVLDDLIAEHSA